MPKAEKRIPLTEDRFHELGELKDAGQTWDELLGELVQAQKERNLARMFRESKENDDFVPLREALADELAQRRRAKLTDDASALGESTGARVDTEDITNAVRKTREEH